MQLDEGAEAGAEAGARAVHPRGDLPVDERADGEAHGKAATVDLGLFHLNLSLSSTWRALPGTTKPTASASCSRVAWSMFTSNALPSFCPEAMARVFRPSLALALVRTSPAPAPSCVFFSSPFGAGTAAFTAAAGATRFDLAAQRAASGDGVNR